MSARTPISGQQYAISYHDYEATIASVGASLRTLRHRGRDLVVPFAKDQIRPVYRGAILAPWPNRVVDGRYTFAGQEQQLALNEPERGHALHGLVHWQDFAPAELHDDRIELVAEIPAQEGYPHRIEVRVAFALDEDGLSTTATGTNTGDSTAPWGTGPHPYLVAGLGRVDAWTLELPAAQVLTVTPDRFVPVALAEVATEQDGALDFRATRIIGDTFIDHAFTGLHRDARGVTAVRVRSSGGEGVSMSWDGACDWVQIHTADRPDPAESRLGLAVEPMTCAPDALNSGVGLVHLAPAARHAASWRISAIG